MIENEKIREELLNAVNGLTDEQLNAHPEEGRWSVIQVLDHLYLMERAITKSIGDKLQSDERIPAVDKPIELTVNREMKVEAPSYLVPSDSYQTLQEVKDKLAESRSAFVQLVDNADESDLEQKSFPHPLFKDLSLKQWIPFVGLHEKRHLLQIEEIKSKL